MGSVSQPKSDRLSYPMLSSFIYLCNLQSGSSVPTNFLGIEET